MVTTTDTLVAREPAVIHAGDYLNKIIGEQIERECRTLIGEGYSRVIVNFSQTELVNSIGISILLGVIDVASKHGASVAFSDVNDHTIELFDMLGLTKHVEIV